MLILLNIAHFTISEETDLGSGLDKRENYLNSIADFDDVIEQKDVFDRQIESSLDNVLRVPSGDKNINRAVNIQVVEVNTPSNKTTLAPGMNKCGSVTENTLGNVPPLKTTNCSDSKCNNDNGALCKPDLAKNCDKVLTGGCEEVNKEFANIDMEKVKSSLCNESLTPDANNPLSNPKIEMPKYKRFQQPFLNSNPINLNKHIHQNEKNQLQTLKFSHQNYIFKPFTTYWQYKKRKRRQQFNSRKAPSSLINAILNQKLNMKRKASGVKSKHKKRGASFAISLGEMGQVFNDNYLKMQHYAATYIPITIDPEYPSTEKKQHKRLEDGGNLQVLDSINPDLFNVFQNGFGSDADFFATTGMPSTSNFEYDPKYHAINKFNWKDIESLAHLPINLYSPATDMYKSEENLKTAPTKTSKYIPTHYEEKSATSTSIIDSTSSMHTSTPSVTSPTTAATTGHILYLPTKSSTTTTTPNPLAWEDTFLKGVSTSKASNTNKKDEHEKDSDDDDDYDDYVIKDNKIHMNKNGNIRQARSCGNDTEVCTNNIPSMPEIHNLIKLKLINKLLNTSFACFENGNKTREHFEVKRPIAIAENVNRIQKRNELNNTSNQCILLSVLTHLVISRELLEKLLKSKEGVISEDIFYNISHEASSTDPSYNVFNKSTEKYSTKHNEGVSSDDDDTPTLKKIKELPKLAPQLLVTPPADKMPVYLNESTTLIQTPIVLTTLTYGLTPFQTTTKFTSNECEMSTSNNGLVKSSLENAFSDQQNITTNPTFGTITVNSSSPLITSSQQVDSPSTTGLKKVWLESVKSNGGLISNNENDTSGAQSSNNATNITKIDNCNIDASTSKAERLHRDLNVVNQIQDILNEINKYTHKLNENIHNKDGKKRSKREIKTNFAQKVVNMPNMISPSGNQLIRNFYFPKVNLKTNKLLQDPLKNHETKEEKLSKLRDLDNFLNSLHLQTELDKRNGEKNKRFLFRKRKPRKKKRKRKLWKKLYGRDSEYRPFLDQH